MKKWGIMAALVAVAVGAFFAWKAFKGRGDSMASSLPADISMVGRVDAKQLALDYGLSFSDLKSWLLSGDKEEVGIDLVTPAYVFASEQSLGAIVPLDDAKQFAQFLREKGYITEEQRGLLWTVLDGNILMGIDDDRAMLMGPAVGEAQDFLRNTIAECLRQDASQSGKQSKIYEQMTQRKEPIALATTMAALPDGIVPRPVSKLLRNIDLSELGLSAGLTAHKERISLSLTPQSDNTTVNSFLDKLNEVFQPIDGSLVQSAPARPALHLEIGLDGTKLLTLLRQNQAIRTVMLMLNTLFDFDMLMNNIAGDVSLTWPSLSGDFVMQASVTDDSFIQNVSSWNDKLTRLAGLQFQSATANQASANYKGKTYYFSTNNNLLRISRTPSLAYSTGHYDVKHHIQDEMKGCRLFASADLAELTQALGEGQTERYLKLFQRVDISLTTTRELRIDLVAREGANLLQELMTQTQD